VGVKRNKGIKGKADKLFSEVIRSVGHCEADGFDGVKCSPQLQCMHIISRKYNATRCDLRNAFSGCAAHHRYFTDHPRQFSRFITTTWAQDYYDQMYQRSRNSAIGKLVDWEERVALFIDIKEGRITLKEARAIEDN
jgi:hypothetical protein